MKFWYKFHKISIEILWNFSTNFTWNFRSIPQHLHPPSMKICWRIGKFFTMCGIRTLDIELFGPIYENLLHDGKNFYRLGDSNPGGGGAFWQKLGGGHLPVRVNRHQNCRVPGACMRCRVPVPVPVRFCQLVPGADRHPAPTRHRWFGVWWW